jgi:hypothetical protein
VADESSLDLAEMRYHFGHDLDGTEADDLVFGVESLIEPFEEASDEAGGKGVVIIVVIVCGAIFSLLFGY